jgi:hypothetical protein
MSTEEIKNKISIYGLTTDLHSAVRALTRPSVSRNTIHLALNSDHPTPLREFIRETAKKMVAEYENALPPQHPFPITADTRLMVAS